MPFPFSALLAFGRRLAVLAMASACLASLGCAGPAWADYETTRAVDSAPADDSFPSAAEVGLAAGSTTGEDNR